MNAFSQIVCGADGVRGCFDELPGARVWWQLVLALHGKPTDADLSLERRAYSVENSAASAA